MSTRQRSIRQVYWSAVLLVSLTGCARWQVQSATPQALLSERHPSRVRVTRSDDTTVVLYAPEVVGDTLYGSARGGRGAAIARTAVPLSGISQVAIRRGDPIATGALGLGSAAVAAGAAILIWAASMPDD
jgi:hypothetical protein